MFVDECCASGMIGRLIKNVLIIKLQYTHAAPYNPQILASYRTVPPFHPVESRSKYQMVCVAAGLFVRSSKSGHPAHPALLRTEEKALPRLIVSPSSS